ncbi:MAG: DUF2330 domain-containing protein [Dehalococcoidia bacterium]|nr:DUF2330 domain-containing protein [Dehalococcoidia bacterium]
MPVIVSMFLVILLFPCSAHADKGMIPISDVSVYGPGQKAIIAWNGEEEILILSTDVYASGDSLVLEILPLPAKPKRIEKADVQSFVEIGRLMDLHLPMPPRPKTPVPGIPKKEVEIVFHEKIGAHDITVVKASDVQGFMNWAEGFLTEQGIGQRLSSPELEEVIGGYVEQKMNFFVFDLIDITLEEKSIEPICYQFNTDSLYYPLVISSLASGWTEISLFLLTPEPVRAFGLPGQMKIAYYHGQKVQFELESGELEAVDPDIAGLLGDHAWLTGVSYEGELADLKEDFRLPSPITLAEDESLYVNPSGERPVEIEGVVIEAQTLQVKAEVYSGFSYQPFSARIRVDRTVQEVVIEVAGVTATTKHQIHIMGSSLYVASEGGLVKVRLLPNELPGLSLKPQEIYEIQLMIEESEREEVEGELFTEVSLGTTPIYVSKGVAKGRLLGFIPVHMDITTTIDAQDGDILKEQKPWWSFLFLYRGQVSYGPA